jgi:hypothetical protein
MKFLIDTQRDKLSERMKTSDLIMGQLVTPITNYAITDGVFAIDNGAFSSFNRKAFKNLLEKAREKIEKCLFVACPDIVGNGRLTLDLFQRSHEFIPGGWKRALVAQDGVENLTIPWDRVDCLFIGGRDPWKDSQASQDLVRCAKILGKWVHVGRVNTPKRFDLFDSLGADTCDGSGVAMYDHMLERIENRNKVPKTPSLFVEQMEFFQ